MEPVKRTRGHEREARCIDAEIDEEDRRVWRQLRDPLQHLIESQRVEPFERHSVTEWFGRATKIFVPKSFERGSADSPRNVLRVRKDSENVFDPSGEVECARDVSVVSGESCLIDSASLGGRNDQWC